MAEAFPVLEDLRIVPHRGGAKLMARAQVSSRVRNAWRMGQGSQSVVLKKIARGGTKTPQQLGRQLDYIGMKADDVFGNGIGLQIDDDGFGSLSASQITDTVERWSEGWKGTPQNGHTTHLLISFPEDVAPMDARHIVEEWAEEVFIRSPHQDEEWEYVGALHTDRPHPHVHLVINNRGVLNGDWFFLAKSHHFNYADLKDRIAEIAHEYDYALDTSFRLDRGILTYGPEREEVERARQLGTEPLCKPLTGDALKRGLAYIKEGAALTRRLGDFAAEMGAGGLSARFTQTEAALSDFAPVAPCETVERSLSFEEAVMEFYNHDAGDGPNHEDGYKMISLSGFLAGFGDDTTSEMLKLIPSGIVYAQPVQGDELSVDGVGGTVGAKLAQHIISEATRGAEVIGLDGKVFEDRFSEGATSAFEERQWMIDDLNQIISNADVEHLSQETLKVALDGLGAFYTNLEAFCRSYAQDAHEIAQANTAESARQQEAQMLAEALAQDRLTACREILLDGWHRAQEQEALPVFDDQAAEIYRQAFGALLDDESIRDIARGNMADLMEAFGISNPSDAWSLGDHLLSMAQAYDCTHLDLNALERTNDLDHGFEL